MAPKLGGGGEKCTLCKTTCYAAEKITTSSGTIFKQGCFRCTQCRRPLTLSTYVEDAATHRLYCQPHYKQLAAKAGLAAVAAGGIDSSQGALVEKRKKQELAEEAERLKVGSGVWVAVDECGEEAQRALKASASEPFVAGTLLATNEDGSFDVELTAKKGAAARVTAPAPAVSLADGDGSTKVDNLQLLHLTEANLLHNLRSRFGDGHIYTWTGDHELLALNPYEDMPATYALPGAKHEPGAAPPTKGSPHAYSVGERAYTGAANGEAQAVVISGESGAGKTETNRHMLAYLRWRSAGDDGERRVAEGVCASITVANRVLEAIGNARTVHNDNSSRFGKYLELFLAPASGAIERGAFRCFLLERSRVVRQSEGEQNFHIFYALLGGAPAPLLQQLGLSSAVNAHRLAPGTSVASAADAFAELEADLAAADLPVEQLGTVLAAIVRLGDVHFVEKDEGSAIGPAEGGGGGGGGAIASAKMALSGKSPRGGGGGGGGGGDAAGRGTVALAAAAKVIGVSVDELEERLISRFLCVGKDEVVVPLPPKDASAERDALAKAMYQRLFALVVEKLGAMLDPAAIPKVAAFAPKATAAQSSGHSIGLLDVFGFETLAQNSLEQVSWRALC